jgi:acetolactate synthase-1/2/3 large subunit
MRIADYIAQTLVRHGIRDLFMVTGGGAMHLNDAFGRCDGLRYVCCHHEQACAMAAESYARVTGGIGVINVTTGPGGINALNGVFGAWTDSIPLLVISGQVKRETCLATFAIPGLRQLGDQEADIIGMAKGITKYAVLVTEPTSIRYHLERALHLAASGRPGPCWLDIPIDVQASIIEPDALQGYDPQDDAHRPQDALGSVCKDVLARLLQARRPVIMVGKGVRSARMESCFRRIAARLGIPVVTAWTGIDLMASDDPLFCGRPGDLGDRGGNFTVQNADALLVLGTRLGLRQVSYNWKSFARAAYTMQVDVDPAEFLKPTVQIDMPVLCDLKDFLPAFERELDADTHSAGNPHANWLAWCKERQRRYPVLQTQHCEIRDDRINPYYFMSALFSQLDRDDVVVCGNGTANVAGFQSAFIQDGQRMFCNTGDASMGYGLPAAIGAAVGGSPRRVICLDGDGSIMMNIQELQTIAQHGWPIKIFVLDNSGYLSIRQSQQRFFGRLVGESAETGISFPDFCGVAAAFGLPSQRAAGAGFADAVRDVLATPGPSLCHVLLDPQQGFEPRLAARSLPDGRIVSPPLEDMFPFLSREELADNLLIPDEPQ